MGEAKEIDIGGLKMLQGAATVEKGMPDIPKVVGTLRETGKSDEQIAACMATVTGNCPEITAILLSETFGKDEGGTKH